MKDLAMKAVVTFANGGTYRQEHAWTQAFDDPDVSAWFAKALQRVKDHTAKTLAQPAKDADRTAVLDIAIDGVADPTITAKVNRRQMKDTQRLWRELEGELLDLEDRVHAKRGRP